MTRETSLSRVLLPAPLWPMTPMTSPWLTSRLTSHNALNSSCWTRPCIRRIAYSLKLRICSRGAWYSTETFSRRITTSPASERFVVAPSEMISDSISKLISFPGKKPPAEYEGQQGGDGGGGPCLRARHTPDGQRFAKNLHQVIHRIDLEQPSKPPRDDLFRIDDRSHIHPRRQQNLIHLHHVMKIGGHSRQKKRDSEREHRRQDYRPRQNQGHRANRDSGDDYYYEERNQ